MTKRKKSLTGREKRDRDRVRKRQEREKPATQDASPDEKVTESSVPCGTEDGAMSAPPGNFPGIGSMGFPPKEEKPLARVQASPRVKMHSPAPRLSPPRGSRLFVHDEGKAPSTDSPPWVCAPPRAPGSDIVHMSDPAGQAQLDTSRMEETSRISKDEGTLTNSKLETERISNGNLYEKPDILESINRERNMLETVESMLDFRDDTEIIENELKNEGKKDMKLTNERIFHRKKGQNIGDLNIQGDQKESTSMQDCPGEENTNLEARNSYSVSVQGSFHQADPMFGDNAGTQCVANCLSAIAYHVLKSAKIWQTADVNKVLVNGDELYTYLQNSSSVTSRYLLVEELPQYFECFSKTFEFTVKVSVPSLISLSEEEPCYEDFNAYPLFEALQMALHETVGCFVCFGGNTLVVGKTTDGFFIFDSHSRCSRGYLSVHGKSTRILLQDVHGVYLHLKSLAISMGFSRTVECELTGVICSLKNFAMAEVFDQEEAERDFGAEKGSNQDVLSTAQPEMLQTDEVVFEGEESKLHDFIPLSVQNQKDLCRKLGFSYFDSGSNHNLVSVRDMGVPRSCKDIERDGNCFFRAISFSLTNSENHHKQIREIVCQHLLKNETTFQQFMRSEGSIRSYLLSSKMTHEGVWATELEILAVAHMLNVDIFTYSDMRWLQFSGHGLCAESVNLKEAIYLYHREQNHYDVVLQVTSRLAEIDYFPMKNPSRREYSVRKENRMRMRRCNASKLKVAVDSNENRKTALKKKYMENEGFREKMLKHKRTMYTNNDFKLKAQMSNRHRYRKNIAYQLKYALNAEHRKKVLKRSKEKYETDLNHKEKKKRQSVGKYHLDDKHRECAKRRSKEKYWTDLEHQKNVKKASTEKYKTDFVHKAKLQRTMLDKYKTDEFYQKKNKAANVSRYRRNEAFRAEKKEQARRRYQLNAEVQLNTKNRSKASYKSSFNVQERKKKKVQQNRVINKNNMKQAEEVVRSFKENASKGPDYACTCCHRLLFKNQVQVCEHQMYEKNEAARTISHICLLDKYLHECSQSCPETCTKSSSWICYTCHRKILSGKPPPEAATNNMTLEDIPPELAILNSLEQHLIALHIPFMKIMALPHGGQRNVHGPVVCVPSDMTKTTGLPKQEDDNLLLRVKLKRKLAYKGYFEYQFVNTNHVMSALSFLKENNQWYKNVKIESIQKEDMENPGQMKDGEEENEESNENEDQMIAFDTCLQPVDVAQEVLDHYFDDVYNIAPGEGKNPVRMLQEPGNEAKAFPYHFPSGRFSWSEERSQKLTLSRYFNNRLMNADNRFAKDTNYIFFSQYMSELNQVIEKTQISLRKSLSKCTSGKPVTANMLQDPTTLSSLLRNDEAIRFMQPIRGTPAYWATAQKDLFAMLRQLGIPTWFCSFSAAEYRWNDAVRAILRQQSDDRDPNEMDWSEKNEVLRCNPVTVARMFEHRFQIFHKEVILSPCEPIGKVVDFFQRVEFQQRGSPHMHCLYWVANAPNIDTDGEEVVCNFVDRYVTCGIPSEIDDAELRKSVLDVQQHSKNHSKSCKKKGTNCRFNFPRPPSQRTFITISSEEENIDKSESEAREKKVNKAYAEEILLSVWDKIQNDGEGKTSKEIFDDLALTQELYEEAYNMLSTRRSIVLQRNPNEVWTNQYSQCLLKCWDANMDIQFVLDPFSCIVYIVSYISKSEREMGMLLKQTKLEAEEGNLNARQTMKKIGSAYLHHREVSAQEAVYRVCNLRMKECSRKVVFIPVGDNPLRLSKPLSLIKKKSNDEEIIDDDEADDENDIWMTNIIERYENRPDKPMFHDMCLANFCSEFRVLARSQVPKKENENVFELQNGKGYVQRRTRTQHAVVRYPRFNVEKMSEKYHRSVLQLFLPYRTEKQLKPPGFELYEDFYETGHVKIKGARQLQPVKAIVDLNRSHYAQNEQALDIAQEAYEMDGEPEDAWSRICPETEVLRREGIAQRKENSVQQENDREAIPDIESEMNNADVLYHVHQNVISRDEMLPVLQTLNEQQSEVFYLLREWCLAKINGEKCEPLHLFVTGGAGTGKSHLIKAIHYEASRLLSRMNSEPEKVTVLLSAFTGTAAFNIGGNTLHHLFSLTKYMPLPYEPLREQSLSEMRVKIGDIQILIIDEVSMVYKKLLYYVHERLVQIKKCKDPFGGVCVIAVGDFYQLPPVKQRKNERLYKENLTYPVDYWFDFFKVIELNEIMRQKEDKSFAELLNSLRVRQTNEPLTEEQNLMLERCIREGPEDVLHVFCTNEEVNTFNLTMLRNTCEDLLEIDAEDYKKDKTSGKLIQRSKPFIKSNSDGLPNSLLLSIDARVMLTRNCNVEDGLVNGVMGYVSQFLYKENSATCLKAVGVLFDNKEVGRKLGQKTKDGNMVLIERIQEEMKEKTVSVVRHQFPLRLSWACTAHKVQGMTTDRIVVNLDRTFAPGQAYVALSRVTSEGGLFIETEDAAKLKKKIYADPEVKAAITEMPKFIFDDLLQALKSSGIKVVLQNIQSLGRHFGDLKNDERFKNVDIICLTETWLRAGVNTENFLLDGFQFYHLPRQEAYDDNTVLTQQLRHSKGGGVGLYFRDNSDTFDILPLPKMNIEALALKLPQEEIVIVIVYRPCKADMTTFLHSLKRVLDFTMSVYLCSIGGL
ncbi:uncharacterized protein LOC134242498 [Saccostrea cucullata]|uniref:uncharacterized protein LOC134242498 n=1 Tax=Saccostrea cuccullata TaxID=36930 RepID=UPI002ED2FF56